MVVAVDTFTGPATVAAPAEDNQYSTLHRRTSFLEGE